MRLYLSVNILLAAAVIQLLCGVRSSSQRNTCGISKIPSLITDGVEAAPGIFPWHVIVYQKTLTGLYEQICAGSLISENVVVSAAHCFFDEIKKMKIDAKAFAVAAGKHYRPYDWPENYVQKSVVEFIHLPMRYYGLNGNYAQDIAWLVLETPFDLTTSTVGVICTNFENEFEIGEPQKGKIGKAVSWGHTATDIPNNELQEINVPFIPHEECVPNISRSFRPFVTYDKFCAGYTNKTSLCIGDGGGGLFFNQDGRWYLRGIASVGTPGENGCSGRHPALFTNFGRFIDEMKKNVALSSIKHLKDLL